MKRQRDSRTLSGEDGFTLVEMMVAATMSIVVMLALFTLIDTTTRSSARTAERVAANQLGRPAMQRVIDDLNSTCVSPGLAPILAGSTDAAVSYIHQVGSAASLTPVKRMVALASGTLTEYTYANTGGTAPNWTFATIPTSFRIADRIGKARFGAPSAEVPLFRYYGYTNGAISSTPLPVPLSADNAKLVVQVTVAFAASPAPSSTDDVNTPVNLMDSALLRFSPSNEDTSKAGLPCT